MTDQRDSRSLPRIEVSNVDPDSQENHGRGLFERLGFSNNSDRKNSKISLQENSASRDGSTISVEIDEINFWSCDETVERPPIAEHYRTIDRSNSNHGDGLHPGKILIPSRPSMSDLMDESMQQLERKTRDRFQVESVDPIEPLKEFVSTSDAKLKLGWIEGVLMRCLLDILGVMLFLRITWVAGQAGVMFGTLIVLLAATVTSLTAISMCAICTNGEVKGGGTYFMISRSLGPEFGGSIGVLFSFAYAVGAAMHLVGLAETVRDIMKENGWAIFDNGLADVRIIGLVTCTVWMGSVFAGTAFVSKTQVALLLILTVSMLNYVVGTFFPVSAEESVRGITGYSFGTLTDNMGPSWRDGHNFFSIFGIFFPAASGIMAGANISGDLKDPSMAIPKGTLLAIGITTGIYLCIIWTAGATTVRDAAGIEPLWLINDSSSLYFPACAANNTCPYGLVNYFQVMETDSVWGPLITAGIFAATLSSALSALVSSPKVFQAVCQDRIFPYIEWFGKGYGRDEDPYRAYGLVYIIAMCFILIADLNVIAPIISNFFLAAFAVVNYACFDASFSRSIGFRPTFKYYNKWISLLGAVLCLFVMFITAWATALFSFFCFSVIFMYIRHRKPDINWGSSVQANTYRTALSSILRLTNTVEHVKNYRPQLLVLTGNPVARTPLVDFAYSITKGNSLMICGHVVPAFYYPVDNPNLRAGAHTLLLTAGLGKMRPNILMLGFKSNWHVNGLDGLVEIRDYMDLISDAFENNMGLMVLCSSKGGLDMSEFLEKHDLTDIAKLQLPVFKISIYHSRDSSRKGSRLELDSTNVITPSMTPASPTTLSPVAQRKVHRRKDKNTLSFDNFAFTLGEFEEENPTLKEIKKMEGTNGRLSEISETNMDSPSEDTVAYSTISSMLETENKFLQVVTAKQKLTAVINRFKTKVKAAVIDVWWLYDDGGLTLLIPHLLTQHKSYLEGGKLRVFTIASSPANLKEEQRRMVELLSQFRINCSDVFVLTNMSEPPSESTIVEFENFIAPFRGTTDVLEGQITNDELEAQKCRTNRQLRCREMLLQYSMEADLIVMTMPVPRRKQVSSSLFMAWLHMLTHDLPPTLLVRGNQTSVLTVYS
uniref:Solute carrier family 12 member 2 n=1 Tax=Plectus sambesii TaxID=2011161 RepID=A0A914W2W5_9BILA